MDELRECLYVTSNQTAVSDESQKTPTRIVRQLHWRAPIDHMSCVVLQTKPKKWGGLLYIGSCVSKRSRYKRLELSPPLLCVRVVFIKLV